MRPLPASIQLKVATREDIPALVAAGDNLFDFPVKPDRAREFFADPRHHLVLALDGNKAVGMVSAFHYVHPDKDPTLFINEASVIKTCQGQGIGQNLVRFMVDYGRQHLDCREVWVATENSNVTAQNAYLAAGGKKDDEGVVLIEF